MRITAFAGRVTKEILRDPLNLFFGLGFPLVVLCLLSAIQANVPVSLFELDRLTPGITVFGLSFMTLFASLLIAKDRESALLQRLYTTPLTAADFIGGYVLPLLPMALAQSGICYLAAAVLGLRLTANVLLALLGILPVALFYIALGLLCGSVFNSKQVGGLCGALLTNLSAWLSGIWFDVSLVGGAFKTIADWLPFIHAVEMEKALFGGDIAAKQRFFHFYGVDERKPIGDGLKRAADERNVKPYPRQPRREVGQQRAAQTADLLGIKHTAAQQPQGDIEKRHRQDAEQGEQDIRRQPQAQHRRREIANPALRERHRQQRQHIPADEIGGGQRRGVQALQQRALAVFGDEQRGKQRHEGQPEHRDTGGQAVEFEQAHRHIRLNGAEQAQHHQRKTQPEKQVERVA